MRRTQKCLTHAREKDQSFFIPRDLTCSYCRLQTDIYTTNRWVFRNKVCDKSVSFIRVCTVPITTAKDKRRVTYKYDLRPESNKPTALTRLFLHPMT